MFLGDRSNISRRIVLASAAFGRFINGIFSNRSISTRLKISLYGARILPMAIYCAEAWTVRSQEIPSLEVFDVLVLPGRTDKTKHSSPRIRDV